MSLSRCFLSLLVLHERLLSVVLCKLTLLLILMGASSIAEAYETPENLEMGWHGNVQLGALATFGVSDTTAISARSDLTFSDDVFEHELTSKWYRSANRVAVARRNTEGEEIIAADGTVVRDQVRTTTNDRRYVGFQTRWFPRPQYYLFAQADLEFNRPVDIDVSSRQVVGLGYKLWNTRKDFISAAVGVGRKRLAQVSGATEAGAIAYLGLRLRRKVAFNVMLELDLDSDFLGENRFSEAELSLAWKLRNPVALKLKYEARFNSNIINPLNTFDDGVEAALSVNVEVDVFR